MGVLEEFYTCFPFTGKYFEKVQRTLYVELKKN